MLAYSGPGRVAQSESCLTADPGVVSLIPAWFHTFVKIDHEMISTAILLPSADSRRVVSFKRKYVHEVKVNRLVKKVVRLTDSPDMTIAVNWDVKPQTKLTKTIDRLSQARLQ